MIDACIQIRNLSKRFGDRVILDDISFDIQRGSTTVLVGPSGAGKSTILRLLIGLEKPDSGQILIDGQDVTTLSKKALLAVRKNIGMLFQDGALFNSMTVVDNVAFPLKHHRSMTWQQRRERAIEKLAAVGIPENLVDRTPDALSGGQRKRVGLARALALDPAIVLFDEPTAGLDPVTSANIDALIVDIAQRLHTTFLVITHDVQSCTAIGDTIGLLYKSKLVAYGAKQSVLNASSAEVQQFFQREVQGPIHVL